MTAHLWKGRGRDHVNHLTKFCTQVDYIMSQCTNDKSPFKKGVVKVTWPILNFRAPVISLERLKLCRQILHMSITISYPSDDKPPLKWRGQGHWTHFQFRRPQSYLRNGWNECRQIVYSGRIYQMLALGWHILPPNGRGQGHVRRDPYLNFTPPIISF